MTLIAKILSSESESKIILAKKLNVRELDLQPDTESTYLAYVDQGEESYDVLIELQKNKVTQHTCDCSIHDTFCVHKIAVLFALTSKATEKKTVKKGTTISRAKKLSVNQQILQNLEREDLEAWLLSMLKDNKEMELQFQLHFTSSPEVISTKDVEKSLKEAVVSVVGRRKKIEATEMKKIISIWEKSLEAFWKYTSSNMGNTDTHKLLADLQLSVAMLKDSYSFSSTRYKKFIEQNIQKITKLSLDIKSELTWIEFMDYLWQRIHLDYSNELSIVPLFKSIYELSPMERKAHVAERLLKQLKHKSLDDFSRDIEEFYLDILVENELFDQVYTQFKPHHWAHDYNLKLVLAICPIDEQTAIAYCNEVIKTNLYPEYNIAFIDILDVLYRQSGDVQQLAELKMNNFFLAPNIIDYIFIQDNVQDEKAKTKFRSNLLTKCKNNIARNHAAMLYFSILSYENNYKKMLDSVIYRLNIPTLIEFFDQMYQFNKELLIKRLFTNISFDFDTEKSDIDALLAKISIAYSKQEIEKYVDKSAFYNSLSYHFLQLWKSA